MPEHCKLTFDLYQSKAAAHSIVVKIPQMVTLLPNIHLNSVQV